MNCQQYERKRDAEEGGPRSHRRCTASASESCLTSAAPRAGSRAQLDDRRLFRAEVARTHESAEHTAIVTARPTAGDTLRCLAPTPSFCLSLVHHVIRWGGVDAARDIRAVARRTEEKRASESDAKRRR